MSSRFSPTLWTSPLRDIIIALDLGEEPGIGAIRLTMPLVFWSGRNSDGFQLSLYTSVTTRW